MKPAIIRLMEWTLFLPSFTVLSFVPSQNGGSHSRTKERRGISNSAFSNVASDETIAKEYLLVYWDGCLANTTNWRTQVGIKAARNAWPDMLGESLTPQEGKTTATAWLYNKLSAIRHVLYGGTRNDECNPPIDAAGRSPTIEFALATRLLVEEQTLDCGESVGKSGKYASRYHPQENIGDTDSGRPQSRSDGSMYTRQEKRSSRPLTVGEITVNWCDGGMIRESLLARYHCNYEDPIPVLANEIEHLVKSDRYDVPKIDEKVGYAIRKYVAERRRMRLLLIVDDVSDLQAAQQSLAEASIDHHIAVEPSEAFRDSSEAIPLIIRSSTTIHDILEEAPDGCAVHVVDSLWYRLESAIYLFGDSIPRGKNGVAECIVPDKNLSLSLLPQHAAHESAAIMNPWTRSITAEEICNLLSEPLTEFG